MVFWWLCRELPETALCGDFNCVASECTLAGLCPEQVALFHLF